MASYAYRLNSLLDWQSSSGNAIFAIFNKYGTNKKIRVKRIEAYPWVSPRTLTPVVARRITSIYGGEQVKLIPTDTNSNNLPDTVIVRRNCSVDGLSSTHQKVLNIWPILSPGTSGTGPTSMILTTGGRLSNTHFGNFVLQNKCGYSTGTQYITLLKNEGICLVGSVSSSIYPCLIELVLAYGNTTPAKTYSTTFYAFVGGTTVCPLAILNIGTTTLRVISVIVSPIGTLDTPFLRVVPTASIVSEAASDQNTIVGSSEWVKFDTSSPDLSGIIDCYKNIPIIPYGVPMAYASEGGSATPRGSNYLNTRDFVGPTYISSLVERRTMGVGAILDDWGFSMNKRGNTLVNGELVLNEGEGIAVVSSAETLAIWGGNAALVLNFGADIVVEDIEYELKITGLQADSEVRILNSATSQELAGTEHVGASGEFSYKFIYKPNTYVDIIIMHLDYLCYRLDKIELMSENITIPVKQIYDRNYHNP